MTGVSSARSVFIKDGAEPESFTADGIQVKSNESDTPSGPPTENHTGLPPGQVVKGAKVDLWDSNWSGGRYYWTVMPIDIVPQDEITTTLTSPAFGGDTTINVADGTGIIAGDTLRVGDPPASWRSSAAWPATRSPSPPRIGATHLTGEPSIASPAGSTTRRTS